MKSCSINYRAVHWSFCLNTLHSLRALKPRLHFEHSPGACHPSLPFVRSATPPLHKDAPETQVTASRAFPHFELCKGLNPTRNQRAPKATLLHSACCADADPLLRNSSWTISCYLEGELLQGGAGKDASPVWLTRQKTSRLEE